jgi:branched-chain amino acid transport system substrate-binding protein
MEAEYLGAGKGQPMAHIRKQPLMRHIIYLAGAIALAAAAPAAAQISDDVVKLGVLTDMSSLYSDINGQGAIVATQMAIDDFGGSVNGKKIELISADVQNKADIAAGIAGRWFDIEHVDAILGAGASSSSIATSGVAAEKKRIYLATDPASSDLTGKLCNAYTVHWVYDTAALANGTGSAVVKAGGNSWFFLTADYAFGYALERDVSAVVIASGGKVVGAVRHPLNSSDFSSFLLQAQASKAQVVGLANAGGDTINAIKQAAEFGIVQGGQKIAGLLVFVTDVHSIGLALAQGLYLTEAFYWDQNDGTRAFAKRFGAKMNGRMPTSIQAGYHSATKHYLEASRPWVRTKPSRSWQR